MMKRSARAKEAGRPGTRLHLKDHRSASRGVVLSKRIRFCSRELAAWMEKSWKQLLKLTVS